MVLSACRSCTVDRPGGSATLLSSYLIVRHIAYNAIPGITISDDRYDQLEAESEGDDKEETLWEIIRMYRQTNNTESDFE
jgi:hypothetical protein